MKSKNAKLLSQRFRADVIEFSFHVAVARLFRDLPLSSWEKRRIRYEKAVIGYLDGKYGELIDKLITDAAGSEETKKTEAIIWVMWLQGKEGMPPIVRSCCRQLERIAPSDVKICLLTENTIDQFIQIKDSLKLKYKSGKITATHMSDIIRTKLLAKYGGCWVDATVWFDHWPDQLLEYPFFTLHAPDLFPEFISRGRWTPFLLSVTDSKFYYFQVLEQLYERYWEDHDSLIDYLLCDYFFELIIKKDKKFKRIINQLPENRGFYSLITKLNDAYSEEQYENIIEKSPIQKLTYKGSFRTTDETGGLTYYGHLVNSLGDNDG